ncbi:MAG TPA: polyphosphate kinase 2 family protein [Pyrinomonadaceae bacterium]|nr:polyphosphate kinase 2 family protein [Pyrinomonadaceae bacterium]
MKIDKFLVPEFGEVDLADHPTDYTGDYKDKDEAVDDLAKNIAKMSELQDVLYAQNSQALLIIIQAMDAAGKDSVIEHVMTGVNPQGCQVTSFKQPSIEELDHDYLWRCQRALPGRGMIGIFNRSHYEEVLVVKVHPQYLAGQRLPTGPDTDKQFWKKRYQQIRDWEDMLHANGTHVIKFFLHVSKDEQKKRFLARIEEPDKNWKFSSGDAKERKYWDDYMAAYSEAMESTSTENNPWYIIPADKKWFTRLAVSEIIVDKLKSMDLKYPELSDAEKADLAEAKKMLESEA